MERLNQLRKSLQTEKLDGIFVTNPFNRRYLTGFTGTAGALLITETEAFLVTDFRYIEQAKEQAPLFTIIEHSSVMIEKISELVTEQQIKRLAFEANQVTFSEYQLLNSQLTVELIPTTDIIENIRLIKSDDEITTLKAAANIVDEAFEHILNYIKPGVVELDIANELEFFMRRKGASSSSFTTIVASGYRSALPHGVASTKKIAEGELVTLDYGALFEGYCSDTTRTVAVGEISEQLKEIYDIVLRAQTIGIQNIKAGMSGKEADALTRNYITEQGYGEYFGHSTGHGLGLEVHEGPTLSPRSETILQTNMVVTVEPGIYLPEIGGCRIEDDIIITDYGNERLTQATKKLIQL